MLGLFNRRLFSTVKPTAVIGKIVYPGGSPFPTLSLKLTGNQTFMFSLRPWQTVAQLLSFVKIEDPTIQSLTMYHHPEHPQGGVLEKWSHSTTMDDILKTGFKVKRINETGAEVNDPSVYISINGKLSRIDLPTYEVRVAEQKLEKEEYEKELAALQAIKDKCDKRALSHSERLVWGGLAGLVSQWLILGRLTWWEYSWDVIEPITWFVNMGNSILAYCFFIVYRKDFTCETLSSLTVTKRQSALYKRNGLDLTKYVDLREKIQALEQEMEKISLEYH